MKKFGANLLLLTILSGLLIVPVSSVKFSRVEEQNVLSTEDIRIDYLKERLDEQEDEINKLKEQIEILETTQSTQEE